MQRGGKNIQNSSSSNVSKSTFWTSTARPRFAICMLHVRTFGYQIDQSCVDENMEMNVQDGMTSAFEMAQSAYNRLTAMPTRDVHTLDLVTKLFARSGQVPDMAITVKTINVYQQILENYQELIPRGAPVEDHDIVSMAPADCSPEEAMLIAAQIIYCNRNRLRLVDEKKQMWVDDCKQ